MTGGIVSREYELEENHGGGGLGGGGLGGGGGGLGGGGLGGGGLLGGTQQMRLKENMYIFAKSQVIMLSCNVHSFSKAAEDLIL